MLKWQTPDLYLTLPWMDFILCKAIKTRAENGGRGGSWYQSFCIYLCVGMHVSAFDMNQASEALTAVSLHHGHSCSDAFNLVFTLVSSSQTQTDNAARKHAPSLILYSSLDVWDRFETVGPRQASLHFNWVPGHLEIHVSWSHGILI